MVNVVLSGQGLQCVMKMHPQTLEHYARRRFSLAGGALLEDHNPYCVPTDQIAADCRARGVDYLSFAHYDYLALSDDQRICFAAMKAMQSYGAGAGASRLVGGERLVHRELEADLAGFVGTEAVLAMVSGYGANTALIGHLLTTGDLILADEYVHNSIVSGTRLSRAETLSFRHNDLAELDSILQQYRDKYRRVLVIVEGLYSMDGDIPDLPRLLQIVKQHQAWLMVDEAHSIGVLGHTGRGLCEHHGIDPREVDLIVGTLSKSLVTCGGFICARESIIEWLRYTLPGYVYSVGLPPSTAAAVRTALAIITREPHRVEHLRAISAYFVATARKSGFDVGRAAGLGVVPIMFKDTEAAFLASEALLSAGIYVPPIVQLGVPKDMPRLRFFLSANHSFQDVDRVFDVLTTWREHPGANGLDDGVLLKLASTVQNGDAELLPFTSSLAPPR